MKAYNFRKFTARTGAAVFVSMGLIAGVAGVPATAHSAPPVTYTVMGDSYSAGSGGGAETGNCFQSNNGYATHVAAMTRTVPTNIACAGYTTTQVTEFEVPQLSRDTKLITITAGGNDVAWTTAVGACLLPTSTEAICKAAVANSVYLMRKIPKDATEMLRAIKKKAPKAKILYVGYPRLFEPQNMSVPPFTATQNAGVKHLNNAANLLNGVLAVTALSNRVAFVPVAYKFAGHGVPSATPWLNYPTQFGGTSAFSFHPNAIGYRDGYAAAIRPFL